MEITFDFKDLSSTYQNLRKKKKIFNSFKSIINASKVQPINYNLIPTFNINQPINSTLQLKFSRYSLYQLTNSKINQTNQQHIPLTHITSSNIPLQPKNEYHNNNHNKPIQQIITKSLSYNRTSSPSSNHNNLNNRLKLTNQHNKIKQFDSQIPWTPSTVLNHTSYSTIITNHHKLSQIIIL